MKLFMESAPFITEIHVNRSARRRRSRPLPGPSRSRCCGSPPNHAADGAAVEIYGVLIGVCVVAAIGDVEDLIAGGGQAKAHAAYSPGSMFPKTCHISLQLPPRSSRPLWRRSGWVPPRCSQKGQRTSPPSTSSRSCASWEKRRQDVWWGGLREKAALATAGGFAREGKTGRE